MQNRQDSNAIPMQRKSGKLTLDRADIVIIGNGIAGLTAAIEARRLTPEKRIVMITDQVHPTINTPALKQFAIGKLEREQLLAYPAGTERRERIHVVTARVEAIHAQSKYVTLSGGRGFGYESLLIATGSVPNGLPCNLPGREFDGVLTLHRLKDYLDLRRRLPEVREAVVIGGGVHAIETVMGLLYWGIRVYWCIRGCTFMPHTLDEIASIMVLDHVRHSGAEIHTDTEIVGIVGRVGSVVGVITNRQEMLPCQLVVSCTGTRAATQLTEHCSLPLKHECGIVVDDQLRTSVRDIYAAGDVAALINPQNGRYEPRAQWYAAVSQGRIAGAMMVGHEELAKQPFGVHWHATHLGELCMLTVGDPLSRQGHVEIETDTSQGGYRRLAMIGDRLVGYMALGYSQPDSLVIKRMIDEGHSIKTIKKDLLKGKFDAQNYLARIRSHAAQTMMTRKLPPLAPEQPPVPELPSRRVSEPLSPLPDINLPAASQSVKESAKVQTGPLTPVAIDHTGRPIPAHEEILSVFTGNLPEISYVSHKDDVNKQVAGNPLLSEDVNAFAGNLPEVSYVSNRDDINKQMTGRSPFMDEDVNAFSGNLPEVSRVFHPGELMAQQQSGSAGTPAQAAYLPPLKEQQTTGSMRKLLEYADKSALAAIREKQAGQRSPVVRSSRPQAGGGGQGRRVSKKGGE